MENKQFRMDKKIWNVSVQHMRFLLKKSQQMDEKVFFMNGTKNNKTFCQRKISCVFEGAYFSTLKHNITYYFFFVFFMKNALGPSC